LKKSEFNNTIENFAEQKRFRLFERISIFACLMGVVHFFPDLLNGTQEAPIIDLFISVVMLSFFLIHKRGFHITARILALSFLNLIFTVYACVMPQEVGVYLFYLPLMAISMAVFGTNQRFLRLSFVIVSAVLLAALFISDFDLIGPIQIESANEGTFFLINLISSAFILVVCIYFIVGVNEESEKRLHALAEEIKIKNNSLLKTNAELDRFLYSTSHDLRSPLLSIKGLVNIARNETSDTLALKYLAMMGERAERLDFFIKDIIDYSRNTRTGISNEIVDLQQALEEVEQNFQFLEGASMIHFQNELSAIDAITDRSRILVVLNNLISNAIKYHRLDQEIPFIKVSVSKTSTELSIVVTDNGQGIDADRKERIFEMFYRGTERSQGSGLGLYIVKETVEKMSGTIRVESVEGEGTSFFVIIPLSTDETEIVPVNAEQGQCELINNSMAAVV
jgi:signal transduction histidine kinase